MKPWLLLILLFTGLSFNLCAETIFLNSGKVVDAPIIGRGEDHILVDIKGIEIKYYLIDIRSIAGKKVDNQTPTGRYSYSEVYTYTDSREIIGAAAEEFNKAGKMIQGATEDFEQRTFESSFSSNLDESYKVDTMINDLNEDFDAEYINNDIMY